MLGIRKHFLTEQTVNYSDRLPGEALESPLLEIFKNRLGRHRGFGVIPASF